MAFARVDDQHSGPAGGVEDSSQRLDDPPQQRDVVAQQLTEASWLEEVTLHVDHHERGRGGVKGEFVRTGGDLA